MNLLKLDQRWLNICKNIQWKVFDANGNLIDADLKKSGSFLN